MRRSFVLAHLLRLALILGCGSDDSSTQKCSADSTLGVVQSIFETRGCTASSCHGADAEEASANLDLRPDHLYENVVNVRAGTGDLPLVFPADEERSVLYLKLAAKTLDTELSDFGISGGPMPATADALTEDELAVVRAWIRGGAPRVGVVTRLAHRAPSFALRPNRAFASRSRNGAAPSSRTATRDPEGTVA